MGEGGKGGKDFGGHPFELFKTPRVILTWIVARKIGRCDVGNCFGVDANDLDKQTDQMFNFPCAFLGRVKPIFKPFVDPIPEPLFERKYIFLG